MKKTFKILAIVMAVILVLSFAACSAKGSMNAADSYYGDPMPESPDSLSKPSYDSNYEDEKIDINAGSSSDSFAQAPDLSEKIIYSATCRIETTEFDKALDRLNQLISSYGGFIENSSVDGNTYRNNDGTTVIRNRYASYIIRIPANSFNDFLNETGSIGAVLSKNLNAENITSQFIDTQARLDALKIQEERLLALLEKATSMENIITIEDKLTNVRYDIESYQRSLNYMESKVNYSTVTLKINEVEVYTPTEEPTFFKRLGTSIVESFNNFVDGLGDFVIWFVFAFPTLLILAAIAFVAVIIIRKRIKKRKAQKNIDNEKKQ